MERNLAFLRLLRQLINAGTAAKLVKNLIFINFDANVNAFKTVSM